MKIEWKSCAKIVVCVFALFLAIKYWDNFAKFIGLAISASAPLFIGAAVAYTVNLLMSFYERKFFEKAKNKQAILSTYAIMNYQNKPEASYGKTLSCQ
jgi:predicted PurR-regulated permease PerM